MTKDSRFSMWIVANALGLGIGFWAMLHLRNTIQFGQLSLVSEVAGGFRAYVSQLVTLFLWGVILGLAQARVLKAVVPIVPWILATAMGFSGAVVVIWPLIYLEMWGNIPGPVEPMTLLIGGGSLAGVAQFTLLRRQKVNAGKWLGFWILGLVLSIIPLAVVFTLLARMGVTPSWPVEVALTGSLVGVFAALVSGNALMQCLPQREPVI